MKIVSITITVVFILFLTLKLIGVGLVASWPWWWVLAPMWVPAIAFIAFLTLGFALSYRAHQKEEKEKKAHGGKSRFIRRMEEAARLQEAARQREERKKSGGL